MIPALPKIDFIHLPVPDHNREPTGTLHCEPAGRLRSPRPSKVLMLPTRKEELDHDAV
jgi:hypothetical protein